MNRVYRTVWNCTRKIWVVAGERDSTGGKGRGVFSKAVSALSPARYLGRPALMAVVLCGAAPSYAGTSSWVGGTGDWSEPTNWNNGVPVNYTLNAYIQNGGTVQVTSGSWGGGEIRVGFNAGTTGTVTVEGDDAVLGVGYFGYVGHFGTGTLSIGNGGRVEGDNLVLGMKASGSGIVTVDGLGSMLDDGGSHYVGMEGSGSLTLSNGGSVRVKSGAGSVAIGSSGVLNIGAAAGDSAVAAGSVIAAEVRFGSGTGALVFNHTDSNYLFSPAITGSGSVSLYSGTTTLSGSNTYSGTTTTTINGGTLKVNNGSGSATGAGSVNVNGGGTLWVVAVRSAVPSVWPMAAPWRQATHLAI